MAPGDAMTHPQHTPTANKTSLASYSSVKLQLHTRFIGHDSFQTR